MEMSSSVISQVITHSLILYLIWKLYALLNLICENVISVSILGHGGKLKDDNGDEDDGYDETLIPIDYKTAGQIRDDDILKRLVIPMPAGVFATCVMDCCHSGTVMDLPYIFIADGEQTKMKEESGFNFDSAMAIRAEVAVDQVISEPEPEPKRKVPACCIIS